MSIDYCSLFETRLQRSIKAKNAINVLITRFYEYFVKETNLVQYYRTTPRGSIKLTDTFYEALTDDLANLNDFPIEKLLNEPFQVSLLREMVVFAKERKLEPTVLIKMIRAERTHTTIPYVEQQPSEQLEPKDFDFPVPEILNNDYTEYLALINLFLPSDS